MLKCKRCLTDKPLSDFYESQRTYCKVCWREVVKANRAAKPEKYRAYDRARNTSQHRVEARRAYAQSEHGKEVVNAAKRKWMKANTVKRAAHIILGNAVRDGRVDKPTACHRCKQDTASRRLHAHHHDYTAPLDVEWICAKCHRDEHDRR